MGVLNVTPDSFSDGGQFLDPEAAVEQGRKLVQEGADLLDIGGESTRPGAESVSEEEELRRVVPVIRALHAELDIPLSIDTSKAAVASVALDAGADIINDISGLTADPLMPELALASGAGVVLMHMQGRPRTMQIDPKYVDVRKEVLAWLMGRIQALEEQGMERNRIVVDPGIGFGKTLEHNLDLLTGLSQLQKSGCPLLVGLSRKRFLGMLTGNDVSDRLAGSLSGLVYSLTRGAHIMRVHDVKASVDAARVVDALLEKERQRGMA